MRAPHLADSTYGQQQHRATRTEQSKTPRPSLSHVPCVRCVSAPDTITIRNVRVHPHPTGSRRLRLASASPPPRLRLERLSSAYRRPYRPLERRGRFWRSISSRWSSSSAADLSGTMAWSPLSASPGDGEGFFFLGHTACSTMSRRRPTKTRPPEPRTRARTHTHDV